MVTNLADEVNTDVSIQMAASMDMTIRFFEGDYSATELLTMDLPKLKALIQGRMANLARSRKKLEDEGKADAFAKHTRHGF